MSMSNAVKRLKFISLILQFNDVCVCAKYSSTYVLYIQCTHIQMFSFAIESNALFHSIHSPLYVLFSNFLCVYGVKRQPIFIDKE